MNNDKDTATLYAELEAERFMTDQISLLHEAEDLADGINFMLKSIGEFTDAGRAYVFETSENHTSTNTYEWCAPGIHPEKENLQNLPPEVCANWYRCFEDGKVIVIRDLEDIKESDPLQYENLKRQGIHSLVVVPLYYNGEVIAFYGVDNPPPMFLDYSHDMLEITGSFLISCLKRRKLLAKLFELSYTDALTKLGNRFALSEYVKRINQTQSVLVVYCDITGLKRVNDLQGHEAGDMLIRNACECLRQVFKGYGLFRIGGDELLVICPDITREVADKQVTKLRSTMKEHSVNVAVGKVWLEEMGNDLEHSVIEAEKRMYEDKAEYYKTSGIERRKG